MYTFDEAILTCPHCNSKSTIRLPDIGVHREITCQFCKNVLHASKEEHCVFCEFSSMPCLVVQRQGSCNT